MSPDKLKPWVNNPRVITEDAIARVAASIKALGFGAPIVARKKTREILAGHTRWLAAKQLGLERVPVRLVDVSEADAHLLGIADNKLAEFGRWSSQLAESLAQLTPAERNLAGWGDSEYAKLQAKLDEERANLPVSSEKTCPSCGHKFTPGDTR